MAKPTIAIVDYGVGNIFNIERAFASLGAATVITSDPRQILDADRLLLPGVGAFEAGMERLHADGMIDVLEEFRASGRPLLGICLGMQLLMSESEENGTHVGLNFIRGKVVRFQPSLPDGPRFKVPQTSWNSLERSAAQEHNGWRKTVLSGLPEHAYMYFVHSYCVHVDDPGTSVASTHYGRDTFDSVVAKDNVTGCQFHPERSGEQGLAILRNFVDIRWS
ncbi:MAG: imidazole glycerol phosphate synthase subunit HisH [Gammaproteobacteria bacterium]